MGLKRKTVVVLVLVGVGLISSCVTQKSKDDLSGLGKVYQNTTARYNGYFNAKELMAESMLTLQDQQQDRYSQLLDIYPYSPETNIQPIKANLDQAIEKCSRVVALHRRSDWTDDCYLLVGKAQYMGQDYESAEETLRYLLNNYDPVEDAKDELRAEQSEEKSEKKVSGKKLARQRKKEAKKRRKEYNREVRRRKKGKSARNESLKEELEDDEPVVDLAAKEEAKANRIITDEDVELPENYFMKHRPAFQEGQIWLAKVLIERANYDGAARLLNERQEDPRMFDDLKEELWTTQAYFYFAQEEYQLAIAPLQNAIQFAGDREQKARYSFILAQLQERAGQAGQAVANYEEAIKYSSDYELEFNARLNMTIGGYRAGSQAPGKALADLEKLLKDDKNIDYADQIYYAMAEIALKNGQKQEGIEYLRKSLAMGTGNQAQRAEAYLTLADLYYEGEEFVQAKLYFDSTLTAMPKTDLRYTRVEKLATNLTDIATNLTTIEIQDSLLKIGDLSVNDQREFAYNLLKKEQEAARQAAAAANNSGTNGGPPIAQRQDIRLNRPALQKESSFFAYDDRSIKRGKRDFQAKWGNRSLQDNWRRSNTRGLETDSATEEQEEEIVAAAASALTDEQLDKLLSDVPRTESDKRRAELAILEAMFQLGSLYRDRLDNNQKSIEILEAMNERFPRNNYQLDSWYYLYLAYRNEGDIANSDRYKEMILDKYSSSTYAQVLRNPDFAKDLANKEKEINLFYDQALKAFEGGEHAKAKQMADQAKVRFGVDNPLQPRFALLTAMCVGGLEGEAAYKQALSEVISKYADTDAQRRAREILRILGGATAALPGEAEEQTGTKFTMEEKQVHYILVVFNGEVNLNKAKIAVSDYHREYHKLDRLQISNVFLGSTPQDRLPILIVRRFKDMAESIKYYQGVMQNSGEYIPEGTEYQVFAVSLNNYREILRKKSLNGYKAFFESNYFNSGRGSR